MQYRLIYLLLDPYVPPGVAIGALLQRPNPHSFGVPPANQATFVQPTEAPTLPLPWARLLPHLWGHLGKQSTFDALGAALGPYVTLGPICEIPADTDAEAHVRKLLCKDAP